MQRGSAACVASHLDVRSTTAAFFAAEFYRRLLGGAPAGEALRGARVKTAEEFGAGDPAWAAYSLYGDPGIDLAGRPPAGTRRFRGVVGFLAALILALAVLYPTPVRKESPGTGPPPTVGYLVIESAPGDARIYIDGRRIGVTPHAAELETGVHELTIEKQGYRRWTASVEIVESERTRVSAELEELR
jgi:hypothetical protein